MTVQRFSERHGFGEGAKPLPYDQAPQPLRSEILNFIQDFANERSVSRQLLGLDIYTRLDPYIWRVLNRPPAGNPQGGPWAYYIPTVMRNCAWWQFYDICEDPHKVIAVRFDKDDLGDFTEGINGLFARENVVWRLKDGLIEREFSQPVTETLEKTQTLLNDPRFTGPNEQFNTAVQFLSQRPQPDTQGCANNAVGALEGTARIISGDNQAVLSDLLKRDPLNKIPATLRAVLEKQYAYRGDTPGVVHGQTESGAPSVEEAELILATITSAIVYLVKRFPRT